MPTTSPYSGYPTPVSGDTDDVPGDVLDFVKASEPWYIGHFANAAERTTALAAAGLGDGKLGMICSLASPNRAERFDGTEWLPLVPVKTLVGSAIYGDDHDGVSPIITQTYEDIVTTNGSGGFATTFRQAFPNGLMSVQFSDGDATGAGTVYGGLPANHDLSHAEGVARDLATGDPVASGGRRIFVTAVGW